MAISQVSFMNFVFISSISKLFKGIAKLTKNGRKFEELCAQELFSQAGTAEAMY